VKRSKDAYMKTEYPPKEEVGRGDWEYNGGGEFVQCTP
jgi:hypothetical protein